MSKDTERSIESIPKLSAKSDEKRAVLKLDDMLAEKPRASIKEIDAVNKLVKMINNEKKYSYRPKKSSSK